METLAAAIAGVVAGNVNCMAAVLAASHRALSDAAAMLPRLIVSRFSLTKALEDWRSGLFSAQDIQRWASFVRRGYVSGGASGATLPIRIEYDAHDEVLIADTIGRLDEIGDEIDGHVNASELDEMLRILRQQA
jgi:hypothetical protein